VGGHEAEPRAEPYFGQAVSWMRRSNINVTLRSTSAAAEPGLFVFEFLYLGPSDIGEGTSMRVISVAVIFWPLSHVAT
jgi:hypothetical protein